MQAEKMKLLATAAADTLAQVKSQQPSKAKAVTSAHDGGEKEDEQQEEAAMDADLPGEAETGNQLHLIYQMAWHGNDRIWPLLTFALP